MKFSKYILSIIIVLVLVEHHGEVHAVIEAVCSNCHVSHDFQAALPGIFNGDGKDDCIGCHMDPDMQNLKASFDSGLPPQVNTKNTPLAAGWFYDIGDGAQDASMHNISGVLTEDLTLGLTPPGGTELTGLMTCTTCHRLPNHHASNPGMVTTNYRFLSGISGKGDQYWELSPSATSHNQYKGEEKTRGVSLTQTDTMSAFCARCHGDFHNQIDKNTTNYGQIWTRHPIGVDVASLSGEYSAYVTYNPLAPVGSTSVSQTIVNTVQNAGNGLVTCVSCHRAHGSDYPDLLRWDPALNSGCKVCHSTKS